MGICDLSYPVQSFNSIIQPNGCSEPAVSEPVALQNLAISPTVQSAQSGNGLGLKRLSNSKPRT
nr:MAG: hypothetical protein EDM05_05755 [Leptolyngbya sp. IPPAS B-1204]